MPSKTESSIELRCSLCPKTPTFSDVSHLLTHISSKSHLAHRFKLQIRSQGEADAKMQLEDFDYWYSQNNLDTLLSERLAAKEQKRTTKEKRSRAASNVSTKKEAKRNIKNEMAVERGPPALAQTPRYRAPVPRMYLWPTIGRGAPTPLPDWEQPSSMYDTPTARRRVPNIGHHDTSSNSQLDPQLATPLKLHPVDVEERKIEGKLTDSATKLKGVLWPGMDLFDSATPEMKRLRNQKKDANVLEQMMATSAEVEPAEISYHANGDFRSSRDIFGPLSTENSPAQDPTPKKRRSRKATFAEVSVNVPRLRAPRQRKAVVLQSPEKRHFPSVPSRERTRTGFDNAFMNSAEEDDEFRLTAPDMGKKRTFSIFNDAPEDSPVRTESSLEDHRFEFTSHGFPQFLNSSTSSTLIPASPTPMGKPASVRTFGKENVLPDMATHHQTRRNISGPTHIYPPQMFHDPNYNPLFTPAYARPFGYAEPQNYSETRNAGYSSTFSGEFRHFESMNFSPRRRGQASDSDNVGSGGNMNYGM